VMDSLLNGVLVQAQMTIEKGESEAPTFEILEGRHDTHALRYSANR
jgi:hypothetical protein